MGGRGVNGGKSRPGILKGGVDDSVEVGKGGVVCVSVSVCVCVSVCLCVYVCVSGRIHIPVCSDRGEYEAIGSVGWPRQRL
jgi:hypothetical protein